MAVDLGCGQVRGQRGISVVVWSGWQEERGFGIRGSFDRITAGELIEHRGPPGAMLISRDPL